MAISRSEIRTHTKAELDLMSDAVAVCVRLRLHVEATIDEPDGVERRRSIAHANRIVEFSMSRLEGVKEALMYAETREDRTVAP